MKKVIAMICLTVVGFGLSGCASLPSWDDVRDEARGEMQAVVDILPEGTVDRVEDPDPNSGYPCDGGAMYTGRWLVYMVGSPDVVPYIVGVRDALLDSGFEERVGPLGKVDSYFSTRVGDDRDILISIGAAKNDDGVQLIQLMAYSRCGQEP